MKNTLNDHLLIIIEMLTILKTNNLTTKKLIIKCTIAMTTYSILSRPSK